MVKVLNVAEKPNAAKNIANILSRGSMRMLNGVAKYNKVYEFEVDPFHPQIQNGSGKIAMMMTSVSGHLLNFDFPTSYASWNNVDPKTLFDAPVVKSVNKNMTEVKNNLLNFASRATHLIIWTDCDREGENIGYEIIDTIRNHLPNKNIPVFRAKFSEITSRSIFHSLKNLRQPDKRASDAVDVRSELDLRIGAAFTRFQTLYLQSQGIEPPARVISYGSCQFPTLGFVVDRYLERENFIVEPFWKIDMSFTKDGTQVDFKWSRNRLDDIHQCLNVYIKVVEEPIVARVTKVDMKEKSKWRPTPMDTVTFEKLASNKLRMSAKRAMQIAEKLYTSGFISYPRTETNIFPSSLNLSQFVEQQKESNKWGDFANRLSTEGLTPRQGRNTDNAHPPIYPTKFTNMLSGDEARVYELIVRHFLACLHKDAKGFETSVTADIRGEQFTATGLLIVERNYLDVYVYDKWTDKELPVFTDGEEFIPDELLMTEGKTSPPSLLTESDLIALMEKHGIGTDATHAEHIQTIQDRLYVQKTRDRRFLPLPLGLGLIQAYHEIKEEMSKPNLRSSLEKDLQLICEGKKPRDQVLQHQVQMYRNVFSDLTTKKGLLASTIKNEMSKHRDIRDDSDEPPPGGDYGGGYDDGGGGGGGEGGRGSRGGRGSGGKRKKASNGVVTGSVGATATFSRHDLGDEDGEYFENGDDGEGSTSGSSSRGRGRGRGRSSWRSRGNGRTSGRGKSNWRKSNGRGNRRSSNRRSSWSGNRSSNGSRWTAPSGAVNRVMLDDIDFNEDIF